MAHYLTSHWFGRPPRARYICRRMIELAEMLPPTPSALWTLASQMGLEYAVGGLPFDDPAERRRRSRGTTCRCCARKQRYETPASSWRCIESRPPYNLVKRGLPGRDDEIAVDLHADREHGQAGHPGLVLRVDDRLQLAAHQHRARRRAVGRWSPAYDARGHAASSRRSEHGPIDAKTSCGRTSSTSCSRWCRSPRRRTSSWPCTRTIRRSRRFAASGASCAASRTTSACSTWCRARSTASRCARATSR